jgi:hypothetical protein
MRQPHHSAMVSGNAAGTVENERKICPYPQHAVYTGPAGGENNPANWVQGNFTCR